MSVTFESLTQVEQELVFTSFSRADALRLGQLINEASADYADPIAAEITINGLVVYRYFQDGSLPDSELWLERKRNAVELMQMGSLRFGCWLEKNGESLESRKLNPDDYAPCQCSHDVLYIWGVDFTRMKSEDVKKIVELGFYPGFEDCDFIEY